MSEARTTTDDTKRPWLPPHWFIRMACRAPRDVSPDRRAARALEATPEKWGTFRLTIGRKSGKERIAILGYHDDGPNIVTVAMNGWMEGDPAWWVNLRARPDATIELKGRTLRVRARAAEGEERERLWKLFPDAAPFVVNRKTETAVVVLEPR